MKIKKEFPIYEFNKNLIYLDTAASSLKPRKVIDAISFYYVHYGVNIHRGVYNLSYEATKMYEDARKNVASFINASSDEVIFTRGTTESINMISNFFINLEEGDEIITSELEHHSNFLPWLELAKKKKAKLRFVELNKEGRITVEAFKKVLSKKTKVVALTYVSNVMGFITPIKEIIKLAHEVDALVVVDGAQAVPHFKVDVKDLCVDFFAFSGHKMLGPNGVGILYGKKHLLEKVEPFHYGGEMAEIVTNDSATYKNIPHKFEAGTPIITGAIGLSKAINVINEIGFDYIWAHTKKLYSYALSKLKKVEGITIYNKNNEVGLVTFNINGVHPHDAATIFDKNNICLRAGHHCAQNIHRWLKINSSLRASFYIYNTKEDVDRFVDSVIEARDFFRKF